MDMMWEFAEEYMLKYYADNVILTIIGPQKAIKQLRKTRFSICCKNIVKIADSMKCQGLHLTGNNQE